METGNHRQRILVEGVLGTRMRRQEERKTSGRSVAVLVGGGHRRIAGRVGWAMAAELLEIVTLRLQKCAGQREVWNAASLRAPRTQLHRRQLTEPCKRTNYYIRT